MRKKKVKRKRNKMSGRERKETEKWTEEQKDEKKKEYGWVEKKC